MLRKTRFIVQSGIFFIFVSGLMGCGLSPSRSENRVIEGADSESADAKAGDDLGNSSGDEIKRVISVDSDGTQIIEKEDGTIVEIKPDGTMTVLMPNEDGEICRVTANSLPTGFAQNCAVCHGSENQGGSAPAISSTVSLADFVTKVRSGSPGMPSFAVDKIEDSLLEKYHAYIQSPTKETCEKIAEDNPKLDVNLTCEAPKAIHEPNIWPLSKVEYTNTLNQLIGSNKQWAKLIPGPDTDFVIHDEVHYDKEKFLTLIENAKQAAKDFVAQNDVNNGEYGAWPDYSAEPGVTFVPKVDGSADQGWSDFAPKVLSTVLGNNANAPTGAHSAKMRHHAQGNDLYFLIEVIDQKLVTNGNGEYYKSDSIELFLDPKNKQGAQFSADQYHLFIEQTGKVLQAAGNLDFEHSVQRANGGYTVELKLKDFMTKLSNKSQLKMDLHINNADTEAQGRVFKRTLFTTIDDTYQNPSRMEVLPLEVLTSKAEKINSNCKVVDGKVKSECLDAFITSFGLRALRREMTSTDLINFKKAVESDIFEKAVESIVASMLVSPDFLYRMELPDSSKKNQISSYSLASKISYFFYGSLPDKELFEAAQKNQLQTEAQVRAQVERIVSQDLALDQLSNRIKSWVGISTLKGVDKDKTKYPFYDAQLAEAIDEETTLLIKDVLKSAEGGVKDLYKSNKTFLNKKLADLYGQKGSFLDDALKASDFPAEANRAGLFNRAAYLASNATSSHPAAIRRGVHVLKDVMCFDLPPPPPILAGEGDSEGTGLANRAYVEKLTSQPQCAGCHQAINPIGFSFASYGALGERMAKDRNGFDILTEGLLPSHFNVGKIKNSSELSTKIADNPIMHHCFSKKMLVFLNGRKSTSKDSCSAKEGQQNLYDNNYSIIDMLVKLLTTDSTMRRTY